MRQNMTAAKESTPDPERLGGLHWARRTQGRLTGADRRLLGAMVQEQAERVAERVKRAVGHVPEGALNLSADDLAPPDSRLAREAEEAWREQPSSIAQHSCRTWLFGRALAALDRAALDLELFYAASLLHDSGLASAVAGQDFTLRSAEQVSACARRANLETFRIERLADAITVHTTPGVDPDRDGTLGSYVQAGAMVDVVGARLEDLPTPLVNEVLTRHPRAQFKREITTLLQAEVQAVPDGRFAFAEEKFGLLAAVETAPFPD